MGLAPYGEPKYVDLILRAPDRPQGRRFVPAEPEVLQLPRRPDHDQRGVRRAVRRPAARARRRKLTQREMDLARSVQEVCEEVMLRMARTAHRETGLDNLCLAGGVALNCVGNGRILREGPFKQIWIQPAAGDAGGALGVAQLIWHRHCEQAAARTDGPGRRCGAPTSGPNSRTTRSRRSSTAQGAVYAAPADARSCSDAGRGPLADEKIVGWFNGRMEFGPRALGNRSILGDPRSPRMQAPDEPQDQVP